MKTLKNKTVDIVYVWTNLRKIPPREFPTVDDMENCVEVCSCLEEAIPKFVEIMRFESDALNVEKGKLTNEEYAKRVNAINTKLTELEIKTGQDIIEITFEDATFNNFFQLFEKWGKNWFETLEGYINFRRNMNETNQQTKKKK
jgi:hypothetical protein